MQPLSFRQLSSGSLGSLSDLDGLFQGFFLGERQSPCFFLSESCFFLRDLLFQLFPLFLFVQGLDLCKEEAARGGFSACWRFRICVVALGVDNDAAIGIESSVRACRCRSSRRSSIRIRNRQWLLRFTIVIIVAITIAIVVFAFCFCLLLLLLLLLGELLESPRMVLAPFVLPLLPESQLVRLVVFRCEPLLLLLLRKVRSIDIAQKAVLADQHLDPLPALGAVPWLFRDGIDLEQALSKPGDAGQELGQGRLGRSEGLHQGLLVARTCIGADADADANARGGRCCFGNRWQEGLLLGLPNRGSKDSLVLHQEVIDFLFRGAKLHSCCYF
mmetsp:Transcript_23402/g.64936  ORF Transcript_23402/g.64936 Transcript_23402/m.64936 type:complete len:330 (+) Transcript_23402:728-1717(+)